MNSEQSLVHFKTSLVGTLLSFSPLKPGNLIPRGRHSRRFRLPVALKFPRTMKWSHCVFSDKILLTGIPISRLFDDSAMDFTIGVLESMLMISFFYAKIILNL